jgi:hypothetical protein
VKSIEFETPTFNAKGQVITRIRHSAEQFTKALGKGVSLELIVVRAGSFKWDHWAQETEASHLCYTFIARCRDNKQLIFVRMPSLVGKSGINFKFMVL